MVAIMNLERKLAALGVPNPASVNINNDLDLTALVLWLDDKVFHQLAPEKRTELVAEATASPRNGRWDVHNTYAAALGQPHRLPDDRAAWTAWLLGYALAATCAVGEAEAPPAAEPDAVSPAAIEHLKAIFARLDISQVNGVDAAVDALWQLVEYGGVNHFGLLRAQLRAASETAMSTDVAPSVDMPLGFSTNDDVVNQLALILRLLYVADLRALQTQANEIIASCQALARSALDDPRANVQLGRGRHGR